jgi:hypothetical protein
MVGAVLLAVGVLLVGFTVYTAYEVAKDPGAHLKGLKSSLNVTTEGPSASFAWSAQGYNVSVTDTSTDNGSTIASWFWLFGDGTTYTGRSPPVHTYATSCFQCVEHIVLNVSDRAGYRTTAVGNVTLERNGFTSGATQSPSLQGKIPTPGGMVTALPTVLELFLFMMLIAGSITSAGVQLLRREPRSVPIPVRPRPSGE